MAIRDLTRRRRAIAITAVASLTALTAVGAPSVVLADTPRTMVLTPFAECQVLNPATGVYQVYFGYENHTSGRLSLRVNDFNQVSPGLQYQGQPENFNPGRYSRVFAAEFDRSFASEVSWELNGLTATADAKTPLCESGETGPASDPRPTEVTLNGMVVPATVATTYAFQYGTMPALGASTPARSFAGNRPALVRATVVGLAPQTRYYYRLVVTDAAGSVPAAPRSFITPRSDLAVSTASLPAARAGRAYAVTLRATGGRTPYTWRTTAGVLPAGLRLDPRTGGISGTPRRAGTATVTFQVTDSTPARALTAVRRLTITVKPA